MDTADKDRRYPSPYHQFAEYSQEGENEFNLVRSMLQAFQGQANHVI